MPFVFKELRHFWDWTESDEACRSHCNLRPLQLPLLLPHSPFTYSLSLPPSRLASVCVHASSSLSPIFHCRFVLAGREAEAEAVSSIRPLEARLPLPPAAPSYSSCLQLLSRCRYSHVRSLFAHSDSSQCWIVCVITESGLLSRFEDWIGCCLQL